MWTDDEVERRIFERGGQKYVRDQRGGEDVKRSLRTRSASVARKRAREWLESRDHMFEDEGRHSWREAAEKWAGEYLPGSVKSSTAIRYLYSAQHVQDFFDLMAMERDQSEFYQDQVTTKIIMRFIRWRRKAGIHNRTIQRDLTAMGDILSTCVLEQWRDDNPAKAIDRKVVKVRNKPIVRPPMAEVEIFIAEAPRILGQLADLYWRTGMRLQEANRLKRSQWDETAIRLPDSKTSKGRVIPLDEPTDPDWMRAAAGSLAGTVTTLRSEFVFATSSGNPYQNLAANCRAVKARLRDRGLGEFSWTMHDLRHLFAIMYLESFEPHPRQAIYRLQQIMGHKSIKQTEDYLQFVKPDAPTVEQQEQNQEHG